MLLVGLYKIELFFYYSNNYVSIMSTIIASNIDYSNFPSKSWTEKMDFCNKCNCCARHMISKPRMVLPTVHEFDAIDVLDLEDHRFGMCRCKCRYLARRMCQEDNCEIILASPDPCDLPLPPSCWLAEDPSMVLLDAATEAALDYYWAGQVKACQYAIFHIC
jgi:hypothetical protein